MTWKFLFCGVALLLFQLVLGQNDSMVQLNEVVVSDAKLQKFSNAQQIRVLNDSVLQKNRGSFTNLLLFNSPIYFKENGAGMVSSPSFRGTTAQQTAVIWNGININSQLNGQTDFNTINAADFNSIGIRSGGGSVLYGSGAVGGSIHLTNLLAFNAKTKHQLRANYGSFNSLGLNYGLEGGSEKWAYQASSSRNSSDNDYEYIGRKQKNENGNFYNQSLNFSSGYKINENNFLKFYSHWFDSERYFSGTITVLSKNKYQDFNSRNMLEWVNFNNRLTTKVKLAYLTESYRYFENKDADFYTFGKVKTFLGRYETSYKITEKKEILAVFEVSRNDGEGSDILPKKRTIGSGSIIWKHQLTDKFDYELGVRNEISDRYESPLLFSAGTRLNVTDFYTIKLNASKNYRIPTYNDLYWQGSGNPDLKPEHAIQAEIGQEFNYQNTKLSFIGFYSKLRDMLRWIPNSSGLWQPQNTDKVTIYGLEAVLENKLNFGNHHFALNASYAYTISKRDDLEKQLIYVPIHKANGSVSYSYQKLTAYFQTLLNGEVFTSSDNFYRLDSYNYSNIGADYDFGKTTTYRLGFQVLNLENTNYQNVASRPMPGRHFQVYLTLNL
ncbi:TonB-dependent receptor [Flavobacterium lacus]|nr:TonB-dependent receptor [Flavobacterium lacus]